MKKLLMMGLVAGVLGAGLVGCTDQIPATQDPNQALQVSMTDYFLQNDLGVKVLPPQRIGSGQLHVYLELHNKTDHTLNVDYKYSFVDDHNTQVDNPSGWQSHSLPPRSTEQIDFTSMSAMAADFRVQLRHAK